MSPDRNAHLVERAVERMAGLGFAGAATATAPPVPDGSRPRETFARQAQGPADTNANALSNANANANANAEAGDAAATPVGVDMETLAAAGMAVGGARRSRIAEEWNVTAGRMMRTLRTLRRNAIANTNANLMLVTSSKPQEGKSFSAINLSASLALGQLAEVVLVDLDSKPGALTALLGLAERPGLFDLVADPGLRPEALLVATAIPGFTFLPIGRAASGGPGSAERSITRPVVATIEALARRFSNRLMILDSAPCLATSDASTLAGTVGQIAMVIEAERTQHGDVEAALDLLRPCPNITLFLNKVRQANGHAFGEYDYYNG